MPANMKFVSIEPYEVKSILGPMEPTRREVLLKANWTFNNDGDASDNALLYIDELDSSGNIINPYPIAHYRITLSDGAPIPPGGPYRISGDMATHEDFTKTYNVGDILYLAVSIWGETTESKPTPPYTRRMAVRIVGRGRR